MGCDIHWYVETQDADGIWRVAKAPEELQGGAWGFFVMEGPGWLLNRNYALFDALNGVRCYGERDYNCAEHVHDVIGQLRDPDGDSEYHGVGWPDAFCPELSEELNSWNGDAHSPCWATLRELQDERLALAASYYGEAPGNFEEWKTLLLEMGKLDDDPDKVRALWFYDN